MERLFQPMLQMALQRGWVTPLAAKRAMALRHEGLHPEQVLLGSGLLTKDRYAECLSEACGLPFVDVDRDMKPLKAPEALVSPLVELHGWVMDDSAGLMIAVAHPEPEPLRETMQLVEQSGQEAQWFCVLEQSRPNRSGRAKQSQGEIARMLSELLGRESDWLTVFEDCDGIHAVSVPFPTRSESVMVGSMPWAIVQDWMVRRASQKGWQVQSKFTVPRAIVLHRRSMELAAHPTDWAGLSSFLREPRGLMVFIRPDEATRRKFSFPYDQHSSSRSSWTETDPTWTEAMEPQQQEEALQQVLLGRPMVVFSDRTSWLERLRGTSIPVRIVSRQATPHGSTWMVHSL